MKKSPIFWGNETLQMYGKFEQFFPLVKYIVWVGNIMTPVKTASAETCFFFQMANRKDATANSFVPWGGARQNPFQDVGFVVLNCECWLNSRFVLFMELYQ